MSHIANLNQIACFDKMRGIYMPLISPTPEVFDKIYRIYVYCKTNYMP